MASLDRQVTQNGLGVINAIARGIYNGEQNWLGCGNRWWLCGLYGGRPRQRCQSSKILMESNDVGGIFVGRGMSIASKRAKERQKRSLDKLVTAKTKISRSQF